MEMYDRAAIAVEQFDSGLNCAQAVLTAFTDRLQVDRDTLLKLGAGFGGGMARQQLTCGAVTGAYMVIGMLQEGGPGETGKIKEEAREQCLAFSASFLRSHNSLQCKELLGYDMNTEKGQMEIDIQDLYTKVCASCVKNAVNIVEDITRMNRTNV